MTTPDILITGATGFLGAELVPRLLAARPEARIVCLMRAENAQHLARRRAALLDYAQIPTRLQRRVEALAGDIESDGLGLGAEARPLARRVGEIFHTAATTRFDLTLKDARHVNVTGVRKIVEFARLAHARAGLRGLHHVSTAHVEGDPSSTSAQPAFRNTYESTKWEAEREIDEVAHELPTRIYRPSIIVGDSHTGRTRHYRALYEPVKWVYTRRARLLPLRPETRIDVVPVDFVADAIVALAGREGEPGRGFTIAAGAAAAIRVDEIVEIAVAAANAYHREIGVPPVAMPEIVSPEHMSRVNGEEREHLGRLFEMGSRLMRTQLPYMLQEQLFEDAETTAFLASCDVRCPPLSAYLARIVRFALVHDFGARKP